MGLVILYFGLVSCLLKSGFGSSAFSSLLSFLDFDVVGWFARGTVVVDVG